MVRLAGQVRKEHGKYSRWDVSEGSPHGSVADRNLTENARNQDPDLAQPCSFISHSLFV